MTDKEKRLQELQSSVLSYTTAEKQRLAKEKQLLLQVQKLAGYQKVNTYKIDKSLVFVNESLDDYIEEK